MVQPLVDYRHALASIMHTSPTFLATVADVLLEDDEAIAAQYKSETDTISPQMLDALKQELADNDREGEANGAAPTEDTLGASLPESMARMLSWTD